jgi:hypothetical protein
VRPDLAELAHELPLALASAPQLVLFGSRATQLAMRASDWDLLVVDVAPFLHQRKLDLVFLSGDLLHSPLWLGSELAGHISAYGHWLRGEPDWCSQVFSSTRAFRRKARKVERRLDNLVSAWPALGGAYQRKFASVIRRDVQRLKFLADGAPVPPTRILDDEWLTLESIPTETCSAVSSSRSIRRLLEIVLDTDRTHEL